MGSHTVPSRAARSNCALARDAGQDAVERMRDLLGRVDEQRESLSKNERRVALKTQLHELLGIGPYAKDIQGHKIRWAPQNSADKLKRLLAAVETMDVHSVVEQEALEHVFLTDALF